MGFRRTVLRALGGAIVLVALAAGLFWTIGALGPSGDAGSTIAAGIAETGAGHGQSDAAGPVPVTPVPTEGEEPERDPGSEQEPDGSGSDPSGSDPTDPDVADPGAADPESSDPEEAPEQDTGDDTQEDAGEDTEEDAGEDTESEPEPPVETLPPADVTVQVLDGYQSDGGAAASGVASELADAGYRIVAENPALRYEVTTVLWTAGNEEAGRQVAEAIGAAEARQQSGNLAESVAVHVVVGADRG